LTYFRNECVLKVGQKHSVTAKIDAPTIWWPLWPTTFYIRNESRSRTFYTVKQKRQKPSWPTFVTNAF